MDTQTFSMHMTSIFDLLHILILLRELYDWSCTELEFVTMLRRPRNYRDFILHSLICRFLLLLLLLLLLRNASDLRNCTSYVGACMWVWYCRPPVGAHFHPTPQPPPVPQQLGEKAHLLTVAAVLANETGGAGLRRLQAGARRPAYTGPSSRTAAPAGDRR